MITRSDLSPTHGWGHGFESRGAHMPATGTLPASHGEHEAGDEDEGHYDGQEREGRPAERGQDVQDMVDDG